MILLRAAILPARPVLPLHLAAFAVFYERQVLRNKAKFRLLQFDNINILQHFLKFEWTTPHSCASICFTSLLGTSNSVMKPVDFFFLCQNVGRMRIGDRLLHSFFEVFQRVCSGLFGQGT